MPNLFVQADNPLKSDAWEYGEAIGSESHPFATAQAAALLAQPGDTVLIDPSTTGDAGDDPNDPNLYYGVHNLAIDGEAGDLLPNAENMGQPRISVEGRTVGGLKPKLRLVSFRTVRNWRIANLQKGYDRGSGFDNLTQSAMHGCEDILVEDVKTTGGAWYVQGCAGTMEWIRGENYAPFFGTSGHWTDGQSFRILGYDTSTGAAFPCTYRFGDCSWEDVGGEDGIQFSGGGLDSDAPGRLEVTGCLFQNILQDPHPMAPHTDCVQSLGSAYVLLANNRFIDCNMPFIASDGWNDRIVALNNVFIRCTAGIWGQGTRQWIVAHNTLSGVSSIAIGDRANTINPEFVQKLAIFNNIALFLDIAALAVIDPTSVVENNILTSTPGRVTPWGTQLDGLPEWGSSARLVENDILDNIELANTPINSPGIEQGRTPEGLGLTAEELDLIDIDYLGRTYNPTNRDIGALQSDPGVEVTATARPPYVIERFPDPGSVCDRDATPAATLVPVPGQEIDPSTVSDATAFVRDVSTGTTIPAIVTLGAPDENGGQRVTIDLKANLDPLQEGLLWPRVLFQATLENIEDTEGSPINVSSWEFRSDGPFGPAISGTLEPALYRFDGPIVDGDGPDRLVTIDANGVIVEIEEGETVLLTSEWYNILNNTLVLVPQ